jgi:hypothetical protein
MLNLVINNFSNLIYSCYLACQAVFNNKLYKEMSNKIDVYYYKNIKSSIVNNSSVGLPSHPYHIVDQSP